MQPAWLFARSSTYRIVQLGVCVVLLTVELRMSLTFLPALETHFLLLGCPVQLYEGGSV